MCACLFKIERRSASRPREMDDARFQRVDLITSLYPWMRPHGALCHRSAAFRVRVWEVMHGNGATMGARRGGRYVASSRVRWLTGVTRHDRPRFCEQHAFGPTGPGPCVASRARPLPPRRVASHALEGGPRCLARRLRFQHPADQVVPAAPGEPAAPERRRPMPVLPLRQRAPRPASGTAEPTRSRRRVPRHRTRGVVLLRPRDPPWQCGARDGRPRSNGLAEVFVNNPLSAPICGGANRSPVSARASSARQPVFS